MAHRLAFKDLINLKSLQYDPRAHHTTGERGVGGGRGRGTGREKETMLASTFSQNWGSGSLPVSLKLPFSWQWSVTCR